MSQKLSLEQLLEQLAGYDVKDVVKLQNELPKLAKKKRHEAIRGASHMIDDVLNEYGIVIDDYLEYKTKFKRNKDGKDDHQEPKEEQDKIVKVEPKYVNPKNHEQTWTGRGIMPNWIRDAAAEDNKDVALYLKCINIEKGLNKTLEEMPVNKELVQVGN